jgi:uncharacterized membrane protein
MIFIIVWLAYNHFFPSHAFDNPAYDVLRLVLTIEASFIGSVLLMHQHRQAALDRRITLSDYVVELQIQREIKQLHPLIAALHSDMEKKKNF